MRRRLVGSMLVVALAVVCVFGIPLAIIGATYLETSERYRMDGDAQKVANVITSAEVLKRSVIDEAYLVGQIKRGRHVEVVLANGSRLAAGPDPGDPAIMSNTFTGIDGSVQVVVSEPAEVVREIARTGVLIVFAMGLFSVAMAVGLALIQARRIAEPLEDLAMVAERLGSGDARQRGHRYGTPELDRVGEVLDESARRISEMLAHERRFSQNASHQLRTPLAALMLRLEEIHAAEDLPSVRREADIALTQVDRLTDAVVELLSMNKPSATRRVGAIEVDLVLDQQLAEWSGAFRHASRELRGDGERGLYVLASPGGTAQVVATLVENSLVHGAGTTTVRARLLNDKVVIEVADEGRGVPEPLVSKVFERSVTTREEGTGLGLAIARDLAEADAGRLELIQARPPVFALFLPRTDGPEVPLDVRTRRGRWFTQHRERPRASV